MISKERLEELIKQGRESVIGISKMGTVYLNLDPKKFIGDKHEIDRQQLFESLEDAHWYLDFGNITRTETLKLPNWEEKDMFFEFTDIDGNDIDLTICYGNILIQYYNKDNILTKEYFNKPLTKENYIEACKLCKKLFLGEEI